MFTGIVSEVGTVVAVGGVLRIEAPRTAARLAVGGSVAVNGVCLTAVAVAAPAFEAEIVDETRARSNLGRLAPGSHVNLELPLQAGDPLDGHLVQGHVDATAMVEEMREVQLGRELTVELPAALSAYVAEKGSIAVDGTSLTVTTVDGNNFGIALIPHTLENTVAREYRSGSIVNLEVDMLARYLERLVRPSIERG